MPYALNSPPQTMKLNMKPLLLDLKWKNNWKYRVWRSVAIHSWWSSRFGMNIKPERRTWKRFTKDKKLNPILRVFWYIIVPQSENSKPTCYPNRRLSHHPSFGETFFEVLEMSVVEDPFLILQVNVEPNWIDPSVQYLEEGVLLADYKQARKIKCQTSHHVFYESK